MVIDLSLFKYTILFVTSLTLYLLVVSAVLRLFLYLVPTTKRCWPQRQAIGGRLTHKEAGQTTQSS